MAAGQPQVRDPHLLPPSRRAFYGQFGWDGGTYSGLRAWELKHRTLTSQCVTEHTLFREETRWPGYYYRGDKLKLDDENWHCLTVSRRDPKTGKFSLEKMPVYHIVGDEKEKKAS